MKKYIVVLAGGVGNRLRNVLPKQYILLEDQPVIMHTLAAFHSAKIDLEIVVVINRHYTTYWKNICEHYKFDIPHRVVEGGAERFHSVKNALATLDDRGLVGVHDAVRPFVTKKIIDEAYLVAGERGNAVPAVPATNTIRYLDQENFARSMDRSFVYIVQNPQVFAVKDLKSAYRQEYNPIFYDDATVAESHGIKINLIPGDQRNIKITHPADISIARSILQYNREQMALNLY